MQRPLHPLNSVQSSAEPQRSGIGQKAPSLKPWASIPSAWLKRARQFSHAIEAVNSTIWRSSKCFPSAAARSSDTESGVRDIPSAYASTSFSTPLKASLSR